MNTTPENQAHGRTGIELYLDDAIQPTPYPLLKRVIDTWTGGRDAGRLTTAQQGTGPEPGEIQTITDAPPLTPWAIAQKAKFHQVGRRETIRYTAIIDALRVELAQLNASLESLENDATGAQEKATHAAQASPDPATPRGPGETFADPAGLAARRAREHRNGIAAQQSRAQAAKAAVEATRQRIAVITERLSLAKTVLDDRISELEKFTTRRVASYARGISRKRPHAPVLASLTYWLDLHDAPEDRGDEDPPKLRVV
jgi:hypothetical protein